MTKSKKTAGKYLNKTKENENCYKELSKRLEPDTVYRSCHFVNIHKLVMSNTFFLKNSASTSVWTQVLTNTITSTPMW